MPKLRNRSTVLQKLQLHEHEFSVAGSPPTAYGFELNVFP